MSRLRKAAIRATLAALAFATQTASAVSFLSFDARSIAMGGSSVVTARPHNASVTNPALLIAPQAHLRNQRWVHSYAGARLVDRDEFIDAAEDFEERYKDQSLDDLIDRTIDLAPTEFESGESLRSATAELRLLQADINYLSDKPLRASAAYGFAAGFSTQTWAIAGHVREYLVLGSMVKVSDVDNAAIDRVLNTVDSFAHVVDEVQALREDVAKAESMTLAQAVARADDFLNSVQALDTYIDFRRLSGDVEADAYRGKNIQDYLREPIPDRYYSTIETRGAEVSEQGVSLARSFETTSSATALHVGLALKHVQFTTISFNQPVQEFDLNAYSNESNQRSHSRFNVDAGLVYEISQPIQVGLAVKNLIPYTLDRATGGAIEIRPAARIGMGYKTQKIRLALDADLTKNDALGFDPDKQYLSIGAEYFLWRNTAFRAGLRTNMVDGETLPSLGFGVGGNSGHFDLALAKSTNGDEYAASLQLGLNF